MCIGATERGGPRRCPGDASTQLASAQARYDASCHDLAAAADELEAARKTEARLAAESAAGTRSTPPSSPLSPWHPDSTASAQDRLAHQITTLESDVQSSPWLVSQEPTELGKAQRSVVQLNKFAELAHLRQRHHGQDPAELLAQVAAQKQKLAGYDPSTDTINTAAYLPTLPSLTHDDIGRVQVAADTLTHMRARAFDRLEDGRMWGYATWPQADSAYLTGPERDVLAEYSEAHYYPVNQGLRDDPPTADFRFVDRLDAAIARSPRVPEPVRVLRVTRPVSLGCQDGDDLTKLVGAELTEKGYMSTTLGTQPTSTAALGANVHLDLAVPAGTQAVYLSGDHNGQHKLSKSPVEENELLLARNTRFRIVDVTRSGGLWRVKAVVL